MIHEAVNKGVDWGGVWLLIGGILLTLLGIFFCIKTYKRDDWYNNEYWSSFRLVLLGLFMVFGSILRLTH